MSTPTSLRSILVANRGEIARRVFRTAHSMGMRCVAVFVDADADAPFVADADEAVRLADGYLDGEAIIAAALATGADAIHPGYGFLAENAGFAAAVMWRRVLATSAEVDVGVGPKLGTMAASVAMILLVWNMFAEVRLDKRT